MPRPFARLPRTDHRLPLLLCLLVSVPMLVGALVATGRSAWVRFGGDVARGEIVEIMGDAPALDVRFTTKSGQERHAHVGGSDLNRGWQVGDPLTVYYDPERPADARADLFTEFWLVPLMLAVFGGFFLIPVVFLFGDQVKDLLRRRIDLDRDGQRIQARFVAADLIIDLARLRFGRPTGSVSLEREGEGAYSLTHDGRKRDPLDPAVQRELGLAWVVTAEWNDPRTGRRHRFESEPTDQDPAPLRIRREVPVRIDPANPVRYRVEWPAGSAARSTPKTSAIED